MKKLLTILLTLALSLSLSMPALAAGAETVTPTPPSWCPEEEYAVFEGSPIYEPENWEVVTRLRWAVAQGGLNLGGLPAELSREYRRLQGLRTDSGDWDPGVVFELALVETRMTYTDNNQVTGPYWSSLRHVVEDLPQGLTDKQRYALLIWNARDKLHYDGVCRETCEVVDLLTGYTQFSLDKLISSPVFTAQEQADYRATLPAALSAYQNRVELYLDGRPLEMDVEPEVRDQRIMVPVRAVAEALGADVNWVEETQQVVMTRANSTVVMTMGQTAAQVDGRTVEMDVAPYATQGRTLIPARYVAEFFGQNVTWNNDIRRAEITEDRSGTADSNLEAWALAMGAVYWSMGNTERASGQVPFGIYPRSADMVWELRQSLVQSWGVWGRTGLVDTIRSMTFHGHNDSFLEAAALAEGMSQRQWEELLAQSGEVDKYMWPYTKALSEKWGDKGILAWDLARMSALAQWGYGAGYVTYEEALELVEPAARLACDTFDSWEEFYCNWLEGYSWWARNDVVTYAAEFEANILSHGSTLPEDWKEWYGLPRAYYCRYIMDLPILDDTLFTTGVIGLPEGAAISLEAPAE